MLWRVNLRRMLGRLTSPAWLASVSALVALAIMQLPAWRYLELKIFDFLVVRSAPNEVSLPITIVGIDDATLAALDESWPLARRHHAKLLDNLASAGVAAVGFDLAFASLTRPEDDDPFAAAIQRFGRVVLSAEHAFRETASVRQWTRVDPHALFQLAGAAQGYSSLEVDGDAVLRRVPLVSDAFWRAVLLEFDRLQPGVVALTAASRDMRIRYLGGPHTFTYLSYHQLLDPDRNFAPGWRDFLRDNIVLVGRSVHAIDDIGAAKGEVYQTPFFLKTREFMPRVEAHANLIANMVAGNVLREAHFGWTIALWAAVSLAGLVFMRRWHPLRSGIALIVVVSAVAGTEYGLFANYQLWLPAAGAAMTIAFVYVMQGAVAFVAEQRQKAEIRSAFSMYVSPAVVDQVIAHPERLELGGERRELTIVFSDLAGFTTISEGLDPEQVAALINRHLSDMTQVVMTHGGTVDKFLGDGVMAFWGAPIADAQQSARALAAAVEMQQRTERLAAEIEAEVGVKLKVRIGINRGFCVVGNMGGDTRFDYTAMGDAVNLASRLEGVNKVYGTTILASESVAVAGHGIALREVDAVRVKGKHQGIRVYTPCGDSRLREQSASALAAYRAADFATAQDGWERILDDFPGDPVAAVFVERCAVLRNEGTAPGWDGVTTLDSK